MTTQDLWRMPRITDARPLTYAQTLAADALTALDRGCSPTELAAAADAMYAARLAARLTPVPPPPVPPVPLVVRWLCRLTRHGGAA